MTFFAYNIILLIVIVSFSTIYLTWQRNKQKRHFKKLKKEIELEKKEYEIQFELFKDEMARQDYVIKRLKSQAFDSEGISNFTNLQNQKSGLSNSTDNTSDLSMEVDRLKEEEQKFKEKNRKLWEQSIAIHHEKERIDNLKKKIENEHNQLTNSILYAKRIQTALLPSNDLISECFSEYFVFWQPRDIVSGDFYWVKRINNYTVIAIADCTGHGVPGAFMSALGVAFLNEITHHRNSLLTDEMLEDLRILVKTSLQQKEKVHEAKDGMDLALCVIDREKKKLWFSGANNPLFHFCNGQIIEYKPVKNPIGIYHKEKKFETVQPEIKEGDIFYMFSDGYTDTFGGDKGRKFTKGRFKELLLDMNTLNLDLPSQKHKLQETMKNWLGEKYKQIDDILVFGFKI